MSKRSLTDEQKIVLVEKFLQAYENNPERLQREIDRGLGIDPIHINGKLIDLRIVTLKIITATISVQVLTLLLSPQFSFED